MAGLHVGVDIGGTFTDCVVITEKGSVVTTKSTSTPPHFADGMVSALELASKELDLKFSDFCEKISVLTHGTTVGTNALIQRRGAKVGLITTKGHEDAIHIMRGSRGVTPRNLNQVVHFPESQKPVPIVPKKWIRGISERVDCMGAVVVPINKDDVEKAITELLDQGVEAIAVCLLWSFKTTAHELYVKERIQKRAPGIFVSCSVDLAPKWGEYERMTATALNAYIGPITSDYLKKLDKRLKSAGYEKPLQITQCGGGSISVERAIEAPLLTLDSGPVSGVTGSQFLGRILSIDNVITTDMGGTSFDVGIIHAGQPSFSFMANVAQYEYFIPKVDIQAICSGGGSLAVVDRLTKTLRVGPESLERIQAQHATEKVTRLQPSPMPTWYLATSTPITSWAERLFLIKTSPLLPCRQLPISLALAFTKLQQGLPRSLSSRWLTLFVKPLLKKAWTPATFPFLPSAVRVPCTQVFSPASLVPKRFLCL